MEIVLLSPSDGLGPGAHATDLPIFRSLHRTHPTGQQQMSRADSLLGRAKFVASSALRPAGISIMDLGRIFDHRRVGSDAPKKRVFVLLLLYSFDASAKPSWCNGRQHSAFRGGFDWRESLASLTSVRAWLQTDLATLQGSRCDSQHTPSPGPAESLMCVIFGVSPLPTGCT